MAIIDQSLLITDLADTNLPGHAIRMMTELRRRSGRERRPRERKKSTFKGVSWHSARGSWQATISIADRPYFLGLYANERVAAEIRDSAAFWLQAYRPQKPKLNFPDTVPLITIPVLRIIHRFFEDGEEPGFSHQLPGYDVTRLGEELQRFRRRLQEAEGSRDF